MLMRNKKKTINRPGINNSRGTERTKRKENEVLTIREKRN